MKLKHVIFDDRKSPPRIGFSRDELLYAINDLSDDSPIEIGVKIVLEHLIEQLEEYENA